MKIITAMVQPFMLSKVTSALEEIDDFPGMTVTDVRGFGREKASHARGAPHRVPEISFHRNGEIFIPAKPGIGGEQMFLDGLKPYIAAGFRGRRLTFAFDTGAATSDFYVPFYKAYGDEIRAKYAPKTRRLAGAGGFKEATAYRVKNLVMSFSGKDVHFAEVDVLTEILHDDGRYFYGNLGQDLVKQFEKMTLNFQTMSIIFE